MRTVRGRILLGQMGVLALVLLVLDAFALAALESAYLRERRVFYLTWANIAANTATTRLEDGDPYLRYLARDYAARAGARLLFLDATGRVVVDSFADPALEGQVLRGREPAEALAGREATGVRYLPGPGWVMYAAVPIATAASGPPAGAVFLSAPLRPLYEELRSLALRLLLITAGALALGTAAASLVARVITRPLAALRHAAAELSRGRWGHRVNLRGRDEVAELGRAFDRMAGDLERLDRSRRQFVADASHELRTPLAAMRALAEPLVYGPALPPETYREMVAEILGQVERMQRLADGLLELARLEERLQEGDRLQRERRDLVSLAREAAATVEPLAREKGVRLLVEAGPGVLEAQVDGEAVHRVLCNLLDNGIKHTPAGGTVKLEVARGGDRAVLRVSDTGEGIPAERLPYIFQRFYRGDPARARRTGGAGLGLAIADRLVRLHGGEIGVESTPGRGSVFTVTLPLD